MRLKPLFDHVLVERDDATDKTKGGILLPDTAKEKPQKCKVIAVGNGKMVVSNGEVLCMDMVVQPGDKVLFTTYSGHDVQVDGEKYLIMRQDDILAVLN